MDDIKKNKTPPLLSPQGGKPNPSPQEESEGVPSLLSEGFREVLSVDAIPELVPAAESLNNIQTIGTTILNGVTTWKQLEHDMHQMDVQFNAYVAKLDNDLEQYKISAPIVSKQLDRVNDLMSRILDKVVDMDVKTELDMQNKNRMMDSLDSYIDKMADMMVKLL